MSKLDTGTTNFLFSYIVLYLDGWELQLCGLTNVRLRGIQIIIARGGRKTWLYGKKKAPPVKKLAPGCAVIFWTFSKKKHEKSGVSVKILSKNEKIKILWILIFFKIINAQPVLGAHFRMNKKSKKIEICCFYQTFFDSFQGETRKIQKRKCFLVAIVKGK